MADNEQLLADLFQHPGWKILMARYEARKKGDSEALAREILSSNHERDQRKIDETRGFWRGAEYLLRETRNAGKAFEKAAMKDGESA